MSQEEPQLSLYDSEDKIEGTPFAPAKKTRADYAVREPPSVEETPDGQEKYVSLTEMAQNLLREQSDDSDQGENNVFSGGESTQTSEECFEPPAQRARPVKSLEEIAKVTNEFGDDFTGLQWDGPEDSDEEVEEFLPFKTEFERQQGIRFSKRGIIKYIEE